MNMRSYKRCGCGPKAGGDAGTPGRDAVRQLRIASVPSKARILFVLASAPHCVCDLMAHTKLSQTLVSHHLSDLAKAGLVASEKSGAFVDYSLTGKGRKLVAAVRSLRS